MRRPSLVPFALLLSTTLAVTSPVPRAHEIDIGAPGDDAVVGNGLWQREGPNPASKLAIAREGDFRWTDSEFDLRLPAAPGQHARVRWRAALPGPLILTAGTWRAILQPDGKDDLEHEFFIPASAIGPGPAIILRARMVSPRPRPEGARDKRTLAVMLDKIWIEPANALPDTLAPPVSSGAAIPTLDRIRGIEARPPVSDPAGYVAMLEARGANVVTLGTMNGHGHVFHPTRYGTPHPQMDPAYLPAVTKELRSRGFSILNWVVFNIQDTRRVEDFVIAQRFPQWTMRFIEDPARKPRPSVGMCLASSPYIEHHANLMREAAASDIDGFFFDGFYFAGAPDRDRAGCVCDFCRDAFKADTGLAIPARVDWADAAFRRWTRWRSDRLLAAARTLQSAIREVNPRQTVTFNYNLWPFGEKDWETAIPMWRIRDIGVSQHGYAVPFHLKWMMLGFKCRLGRDINPAHTDIWRTGSGESCWGKGDPDRDWHRDEMTTFILAALSHGITPWHGGMDGPPQVEASVHAEAARRERFYSRKHIASAAVLASENTLQFWGHLPGTSNIVDYQDGLIGSWMLLTENHLPFEFVFDNQIGTGDLEGYASLILPSAAALSRKDAEALKAWTEAGGHLITTGTTGSCDEWGQSRSEPLLRAVFDIDQTTRADKPLGKGRVTHLPSDPGLRWARDRDPAARELINALRRHPQPVTIEAPNWICADPFENPGDPAEKWLHILNIAHLMPNGDSGFRGLKRDPVETRPTKFAVKGRSVGPPITPTKNIRVRLDGPPPKSARLAIAGHDLPVDPNGWITIPEIKLHDVLVIR